MIKHEYLNDWSSFTSKILDSYIEKEDFEKIKYYRDYIMDNLRDQVNLLRKEQNELNSYRKEYSINIEGYGEWQDEISIRLNELEKVVVERFEDKKKSFWSKIF